MATHSFLPKIFASSDTQLNESLFVCTIDSTEITDAYYTTKKFCNQQGAVVQTVRYFVEYNNIISELRELDSRMRPIKILNYNSLGELTGHQIRKYTSDTLYRRFLYSTKNPRLLIGNDFIEVRGTKNFTIESWNFDDRKNRFTYFDEIKAVKIKNIMYDFNSSENEFIDRGIVKTRTMLSKNGEPDISFEFKYVDETSFFNQVSSYKKFNKNNQLVGQFNNAQSLDILQTIKQQSLDYNEKERRKKVYLTPKPVAVIMDSGFDIGHIDLSYKFYKNSAETIDELDNDNNGFIDDIMGWYVNDDGSELNNPTEQIYVNSKSGAPISHGTHVASIAFKGVESTSLLGFAGDYSNSSYISRITKELKRLNVQLFNMSFGFGTTRHPFAPGTESFFAIDQLIKNSDKTLFFIAAGNSGSNLDKYPDYPASTSYENTLVIGAIKSNGVNYYENINFKLTEFSSYGEKTVDIFAPGYNVNGAMAGGGNLKLSGTSMAAPWIMNVALKMKEKNSELSAQMVKKIIMKTALLPSDGRRLPCVSGGVIHPKRAIAVAEYLKNNPNSDLSSALEMVPAVTY
jgi:hypothetical protein